MSNESQEQERLKRLREQQLRARDPHVKQRQHQKMTAERERKRDTSYTLGDLWQDIPLVVRYAVGGFLLGLLVSLILSSLWDSPWLKIVSIAIVIALTVFSGIVGNAIAVREKVKDLMR